MTDDRPDEPRHYEEHLEPAKFVIRSGPIQETYTLGLTEIRLAVLGILVAVALGAAALASGWLWRLVVGLVAFAACCRFIRWPRSRNWLMTFAHWLTDL